MTATTRPTAAGRAPRPPRQEANRRRAVRQETPRRRVPVESVTLVHLSIRRHKVQPQQHPLGDLSLGTQQMRIHVQRAIDSLTQQLHHRNKISPRQVAAEDCAAAGQRALSATDMKRAYSNHRAAECATRRWSTARRRRAPEKWKPSWGYRFGEPSAGGSPSIISTALSYNLPRSLVRAPLSYISHALLIGLNSA